MNDERPRRRSLESFRKEAKRWLRALRDNAQDAQVRLERALGTSPPQPTLRDVQHALAKEQGFSGWSSLTVHLHSASDASDEAMHEYELMAIALLEAYRTGTPEAMERHYQYTWHRRVWSAMRSYVQVDLGIPANPHVDITLDDARFLVAREHGYENWNALASDVATRPMEGVLLTKPMGVMNMDTSHVEHPRLISREWNKLLSALGDEDATVLHANGQMTDELLAGIALFPHLTTLRLGGCGSVTDEGIRHLAKLPKLRLLELNGTAITDRGLSALGELTQLETLSMAWTRISDAGIDKLRTCERISRLDISGTYCGDGSIRALTGKPALTHLSIGNAVTDAGLAALHDYPAFKQWRGPSALDVSLEHRPNRLMLRGPISNSGLAQLRGLDGLFDLNLDDSNMMLDGSGLRHIVGLANLGWLAFDAKDDAMPIIAQMPKLRGLMCQDTPATDVGWVALGQSRTIEKIWARRCHGLGNSGFRALSAMPSLKYWAGSCKNVGDSALSAFPDFPALYELMPMDVPDAGYRHIAKCEQIRVMTLMYCRDTTDVATEHIATMSRLEKYFASYTQITDRTPELLSRIDALQHITFDSCAGLTNVGIAHLARLPNLRELRVSGRGLTAEVRLPFPARVKVHYGL